MQTTAYSDLTIDRLVPASRWPNKLLLVDDHELVRCGVKSMYGELQGVALEWEIQRVGRW